MTTPVHLGDDCWSCILDFLAHDHATLARLMRASKAFFRRAVPVLYKDLYGPTSHGPEREWSPNKTRKLALLLLHSAGVLDDHGCISSETLRAQTALCWRDTKKPLPPDATTALSPGATTWQLNVCSKFGPRSGQIIMADNGKVFISPTMTPPTINYFTLVRYSHDSMFSLMVGKKGRHPPLLQTSTGQDLSTVNKSVNLSQVILEAFHRFEMTFSDRLWKYEICRHRLWKFQGRAHMFPALRNLILCDCQPHTVQEQNHIEVLKDFVCQHAKLFPGQLKSFMTRNPQELLAISQCFQPTDLFLTHTTPNELQVIPGMNAFGVMAPQSVLDCHQHHHHDSHQADCCIWLQRLTEVNCQFAKFGQWLEPVLQNAPLLTNLTLSDIGTPKTFLGPDSKKPVTIQASFAWAVKAREQNSHTLPRIKQLRLRGVAIVPVANEAVDAFRSTLQELCIVAELEPDLQSIHNLLQQHQQLQQQQIQLQTQLEQPEQQIQSQTQLQQPQQHGQSGQQILQLIQPLQQQQVQLQLQIQQVLLQIAQQQPGQQIDPLLQTPSLRAIPASWDWPMLQLRTLELKHTPFALNSLWHCPNLETLILSYQHLGAIPLPPQEIILDDSDQMLHAQPWVLPPKIRTLSLIGLYATTLDYTSLVALGLTLEHLVLEFTMEEYTACDQYNKFLKIDQRHDSGEEAFNKFLATGGSFSKLKWVSLCKQALIYSHVLFLLTPKIQTFQLNHFNDYLIPFQKGALDSLSHESLTSGLEFLVLDQIPLQGGERWDFMALYSPWLGIAASDRTSFPNLCGVSASLTVDGSVIGSKQWPGYREQITSLMKRPRMVYVLVSNVIMPPTMITPATTTATTATDNETWLEEVPDMGAFGTDWNRLENARQILQDRERNLRNGSKDTNFDQWRECVLYCRQTKKIYRLKK